jgi:hypothetical protein
MGEYTCLRRSVAYRVGKPSGFLLQLLEGFRSALSVGFQKRKFFANVA